MLLVLNIPIIIYYVHKRTFGLGGGLSNDLFSFIFITIHNYFIQIAGVVYTLNKTYF